MTYLIRPSSPPPPTPSSLPPPPPPSLFFHTLFSFKDTLKVAFFQSFYIEATLSPPTSTLLVLNAKISSLFLLVFSLHLYPIFVTYSQIKSPYLVTFYGAYIQKKLTMVMEYCPKGTLYDVLKNSNEEISWERVLVFFTQTVKGV